MKHLILTVITVALHYVADSSAQNEVVTYTEKETEQLNCDISSSANFALWVETIGSSDVTIFEYTRGIGVSKPSPGYENFRLDNGTATSFHLIIADVRPDNEGEYTCTRSGGGGLIYKVIVEVIPSSVNIDHNGNEIVNVSESYSFTCTAVGVRSPNVLNITWSTNNIREVVVPERSDSTQGSDLEDLTSTFELSPQKNDTFIKCGITGYVNQDEINEDLIMDTVDLTVHYAPICTLELDAGEVGDSVCTVPLKCNCDANPEVTAGGYSYYKDNSLIDGNSDATTGDVQLDNTAKFSCRGRNSVGSGEQSPAVEYTCSSPSTTSPTTTTVTTTVTTSLIEITSPVSTAATTPTLMKTEMPTATTPTPTMRVKPSPTKEPSSIVLIVVLSCFGGILVVGVAGGSVYWFCFRTSDQESVKRINNLALRGGNTNPSYTEPAYDEVEKDTQAKSTVTASTNETTNSAAPVYGVVNKSTKKKSDNTDGNGVDSKMQSEPDRVEYAAVNKPKPDPQPAPRSSKPPGNNTEPEKVELQYADIDHSNRGRSNEIRQPADEPTEYATVQSVIV